MKQQEPADSQIPGHILFSEEGDIFYARVIMGLTRTYKEVHKDEPYDVARLWRGLDAQLKRRPNSTTLDTGEVLFGIEHKDSARLKAFCSEIDTV